MSKRAHTKDVFDRLDEQHSTAEDPAQAPQTLVTADADDTDAASDSADTASHTAREHPGSDRDPSPDHATTNSPSPADDHRPALRRHLRTALPTVAVLTATGLLAAAGWHLKKIDDTASAGRAALAAASEYAVVLTTLDTNDIDRNYQQALDGATGEFKNDYSQGSAQLRQVLIDNHAEGKGVVIDAAVKSATPSKVDVLLFVDQSVTNAVNPSPRIDRSRIQMTMELIDRRWLASKVELL